MTESDHTTGHPVQFNSDSLASIIEHMNDDHSDAVLLYVQVLAGHGSATRATLIDLNGQAMSIRWHAGPGDLGRLVEVPFDPPLSCADDIRPVLVSMIKSARRVSTNQV